MKPAALLLALALLKFLSPSLLPVPLVAMLEVLVEVDTRRAGLTNPVEMCDPRRGGSSGVAVGALAEAADTADAGKSPRHNKYRSAVVANEKVHDEVLRLIISCYSVPFLD